MSGQGYTAQPYSKAIGRCIYSFCLYMFYYLVFTWYSKIGCFPTVIILFITSESICTTWPSSPHVSKVFSPPASPVGIQTMINPESHPLNQDELELLSNWCSVTYLSFSSVWDFDPEVWRTIILRTALHHPSLLEGIFALSALQLAHRSSRQDIPRQKALLKSAYTHKRNAQSGLDNLLQHYPGSVDHDVLFMLYDILVIFEFASIQHFHSSSSSSALDVISRIFRHLRTSTTNLASIVNKIHKQKIAKKPSNPTMPNTFEVAISMLKRFNSQTQHDNPKKRPIYDEAIKQLASCLAYTSWSSKPGIAELSWFLFIPDEMMGLIVDRQPMALIILAHYCAILYHLRDQWWVADLGARVLEDISRFLGHEGISPIRWVIDVTGVCPTFL